MSRSIACVVLLFSSCLYGQTSPLERPASDFNSSGAGLTETLLRFSHQEHLPIAIECVNRASMNQPIQISLRGKTVRQALDSILLNGSGCGWVLRDGIVEITNTGAASHAESLIEEGYSGF